MHGNSYVTARWHHLPIWSSVWQLAWCCVDLVNVFNVLCHLLYICVMCSTAIAVLLTIEPSLHYSRSNISRSLFRMIDICRWCSNCYASMLHSVLLLTICVKVVRSFWQLQVKVVANHADCQVWQQNAIITASMNQCDKTMFVSSVLFPPILLIFCEAYVQYVFYDCIKFHLLALYSDVDI